MDDFPHDDLCPTNRDEPCNCHVAKIAELVRHNDDLGAKLDDKKQIIQLKDWLEKALEIGRVNGRKVADLEKHNNDLCKTVEAYSKRMAELSAESDGWQKACGDCCPKCASINPETDRATDLRDLEIVADLEAKLEKSELQLTCERRKLNQIRDDRKEVMAKRVENKQLLNRNTQLRGALEQVDHERDFRVRCNDYIKGVVSAALAGDSKPPS